MKTIYQTPCISIQPIYHASILCARGDPDRVSGIVHGGQNSGDVTSAF